MSVKPYIVDNEEWHGKVELVCRAVIKGCASQVPPYNSLEKRARRHFKIYCRLKAIHCRPPAFPKIVTDSNLGLWFRRMKRMANKATGVRGIAIRKTIGGAALV